MTLKHRGQYREVCGPETSSDHLSAAVTANYCSAYSCRWWTSRVYKSKRICPVKSCLSRLVSRGSVARAEAMKAPTLERIGTLRRPSVPRPPPAVLRLVFDAISFAAAFGIGLTTEASRSIEMILGSSWPSLFSVLKRKRGPRRANFGDAGLQPHRDYK